MLINDIVTKLNISARAVRFYEEKGLISPQKQANNQYRIFTSCHLFNFSGYYELICYCHSICSFRGYCSNLRDFYSDWQIAIEKKPISEGIGFFLKVNK